jgi:ubiquinone/menaquinone biosynthesis C-methylase UbiE
MARKIYCDGTKLHFDVGSRIDGFVAHLLTFSDVNYVDIRPLNSNVDNLTFIQGTILKLPFEANSINSLSCLHVIEHIGLGRYGDDIDSLGYEKAASELIRVLSPGGKLYFSTPVGKECLHFDAHRVFSYETIMSIFSSLNLMEFSFVDDKSERVLKNVDLNVMYNSEYGCGLFIFQKKW